MFKGFIFDLDGTVYLGERLIPGAERMIRLLREGGRKVVFLSNKPLYTREDYAAKLTRLGIPTEPAEVVNSTFVLIRYLGKVAPGAKVFVMGELPFVAEMVRAGFRLTEEPAEIEYVVAAFDRTFDYRKFNIAFQAIKKGAHFIATNPDRTCPVEGGELPDCAGIIAALEAMTLKKVEVIVGKPSPITVAGGPGGDGTGSRGLHPHRRPSGNGYPHGDGVGDEDGPRHDRRDRPEDPGGLPLPPRLCLTASPIWRYRYREEGEPRPLAGQPDGS